MLKVNGATVQEVVDYLDNVEDAFELFGLWLDEQKPTMSERIYLNVQFSVRFASVSSRTWADGNIAAHKLGVEKVAELDANLKAFVLKNGLMSEAEFNGED